MLFAFYQGHSPFLRDLHSAPAWWLPAPAPGVGAGTGRAVLIPTLFVFHSLRPTSSGDRFCGRGWPQPRVRGRGTGCPQVLPGVPVFAVLRPHTHGCSTGSSVPKPCPQPWGMLVGWEGKLGNELSWGAGVGGPASVCGS